MKILKCLLMIVTAPVILAVSYTHLDVYKRQGTAPTDYRIPDLPFRDHGRLSGR